MESGNEASEPLCEAMTPGRGWGLPGPRGRGKRRKPVHCRRQPDGDTQRPGCLRACEATPHLISLLGPQEMAGHVLRQHVGDQGLIPAPHLVDTFFLVVDLDLPQEQRPCQFFHLWTDAGKVCASAGHPDGKAKSGTRRGSTGETPAGRRPSGQGKRTRREAPTPQWASRPRRGCVELLEPSGYVGA